MNWLEYFQADDLETAVACVREVFRMKGYSVKPTGRFAVLNVETAKEAVSTVAGRPARINHLPLDDDLSHSGIFGYTVDDLAVAAELKTLVGRVDVYAAS